MPEINTFADLIGQLITMAIAVWAAMKVSIEALRQDNERQYEQLAQINTHLETLNSRVSKSEDHIEDLEQREDG